MNLNFEKCILESIGNVLVYANNIFIQPNFSFLNNLCIGLDGDNNVVMMEADDEDNSQFWTWNDDNDSLRNKDGIALDVQGGNTDAGIKYFHFFKQCQI